jgi:pyruvate dehydrogenase E1 component beta subunit
MPEMNMVEAISDALNFEMERDGRVMVLGEDVGRTGGVFRATDGLFDKFGRDRVVDMPLAEGAIVGSSVGLAISGLIPVAEIQFMGFTHNAFNQIAEQLARMRYRSWGSLSTQVTIRTPYGGGVRAPEMHSDSFVAHFAHCPGLKLVAPATAEDAKGLLLSSIRDPDPVMFLEPLRGRLHRTSGPGPNCPRGSRLYRDCLECGGGGRPTGRGRCGRSGSFGRGG